jgi:hypothetical protein
MTAHAIVPVCLLLAVLTVPARAQAAQPGETNIFVAEWVE